MSDRAKLFGIEIDRLTMEQASQQIVTWCEAPFDRCRFVVTPNVDHVVMLQQSEPLQSAYQDASLVLADGRPVVAASKWLRRALPECVPGSELVPTLFGACRKDVGQKFFLLGAGPGVAERAATQIVETWNSPQCVGTYCPPLGFEKDANENQKIIEMINVAEPDLLVIGLGAPKQELWIAKHAPELKAKVAVCAGATIDFLAGEKNRAPKWLRRFSLEWLHRMCSEPKRLVPRYSRDAWFFPQILFRQWLSQRAVR